VGGRERYGEEEYVVMISSGCLEYLRYTASEACIVVRFREPLTRGNGYNNVMQLGYQRSIP